MSDAVEWGALSLNLFVTYSHKDLREVGNPVRTTEFRPPGAPTPAVTALLVVLIFPFKGGPK